MYPTSNAFSITLVFEAIWHLEIGSVSLLCWQVCAGDSDEVLNTPILQLLYLQDLRYILSDYYYPTVTTNGQALLVLTSVARTCGAHCCDQNVVEPPYISFNVSLVPVTVLAHALERGRCMARRGTGQVHMQSKERCCLPPAHCDA